MRFTDVFTRTVLREHCPYNREFLTGGSMKNSMHMDKERHPFQFSTTAGRAGKPPMARMTGVGPKPGGEGSMQSANAAMKKKRPMQGPGSA